MGARKQACTDTDDMHAPAPQDDFFCHAHNRDGLVGVVFVDKEYPVRSAFCVVNKVIDDFVAIHGTKWRAATADSSEAEAMLQPALEKYQVLAPCRLRLLFKCVLTLRQPALGSQTHATSSCRYVMRFLRNVAAFS